MHLKNNNLLLVPHYLHTRAYLAYLNQSPLFLSDYTTQMYEYSSGHLLSF